MKKFFVLTFALMFGLVAVAQKFGHIPSDLQKVSAKTTMQAEQNTMNLSNTYNPYVNANGSKAIGEAQIGTTQYDLQSNGSVQNRILLHPDGTIGATFTYGSTPASFPERGTAYNYFDGAAWGAYPTVRVESGRCGWGSYSDLGAGELVISHNGSTGLYVTSRPAKGTGAWATTTLIGPATTGATTALLWPRSITDGNTIHVIACTDQASSGYYYYQGLAMALVYYKSTDGGATWSAPQVLPGMDSASVVNLYNNKGFSGDGYSWAAPKGDTIAFVAGDSWSDLFAMRSYDAGATWTKVMIYEFPNLTAAPTPIVASHDGSMACAIDDLGKVHVVVGRMRVSDDDFTDDPPTSSYYPYTDGLLYWNESMAAFDSALLNNETQLIANGQYIAGMLDYNASDTIDFPEVASGSFPFGNYGISVTSMPQMIIDDAGDIYVTYSGLREDKINEGATPNVQLYRHLFAMKSVDGGTTFSEVTDLTASPLHNFDECVFGSLSYTSDTKLHLVYQADMEPGLAVRGDEDSYTDNYIYYINVPKDEVGTDIGFEENANISNVAIYPNPASSYATIEMNLTSSQNVNINVFNMIGQSVYSKTYNNLSSGNQNFTLNTASYNSGIYFISIEAGDSKVTRKLIVE